MATSAQAAPTRMPFRIVCAIDADVLRAVDEDEDGVDVEGAVLREPRAHREQHLFRVRAKHLDDRPARFGPLPSTLENAGVSRMRSRMTRPTPTSRMLSRNGTRHPHDRN